MVDIFGQIVILLGVAFLFLSGMFWAISLFGVLIGWTVCGVVCLIIGTVAYMISD